MKKIIMFLVLILIIILNGNVIFANDVDNITILTNESIQYSRVECYDISNNGIVAVGFRNGNVSFYDIDGVYLYTIELGSIGYTFEFNDLNELIIYNYRLGEKITIAYDKVVEIAKFDNTNVSDKLDESSRVYRKNELGEFEFNRKFFSESITRINGTNRIVIYETNTNQVISSIFKLVLILSFITIVIFSLIKKMVDKGKANHNK